ncbi:MAG: hypothetical protein KJ990_07960 [Proteobacteria bacterium]|nr:hypothetical protein [Pseudomonadota bacterium]MBU1650172.1 hypothetical protein [Pseudomonadota bacterium]
MERKSITISYLEFKCGQTSKGISIDIEGLRIEQFTIPRPDFNCFMYRDMGGEWFWINKLNWLAKSGCTM